MKSNIITHNFKLIAWLTFIVYFISTFCGWFNLLFAKLNTRIYFPLRSYLTTFSNNDVINFKKDIFNFAGYKALINSAFPYKVIDDIFYVTICTILIILFLIGYKIIKSNQISQTEIIKWSIIFSVLMTLAIPSHSSDLYGYIARGAQQTLYNQNPYFETVSKIQDYGTNPLFINFMWPEQPTSYGPVFVYITKAIVFLSNNNFLLSFINFKLTNLTIFFLLILFILRLNKTKELYLIAWNPLILIQGLWNCHNDLISGALIFFGIYLLLKEKYFWSVFSLMLALGIKYVSLIIIPMIIFYLLKNKPEKNIFLNIALGICSGIILITIFSMDYFCRDKVILSAQFLNINLVHKSLIDTIITLIKYFSIWQNLNVDFGITLSVLKYFIYGTFIIFYLWILNRKKTNLVYDLVFVLLIFFGFTIAKFHSWYLLNFIVLIPLLENGLLKKILIGLSLAHIFAITFIDQSKILNFVLMTLLPSLFIYLALRLRSRE